MKNLVIAVMLGAGVAGAQAPGPRVAVVLDDFGLNYRKTPPDAEWLRLGFPLTCAVMPESPRTKAAAAAVKAAGKELIIHFPFDPFLRLKLAQDRVLPEDKRLVDELLAKSLKAIPGGAGLNTHRSDRATRNGPLMAAFTAELKGKAGFFLDSRVSPKSVAYEQARAAGLPAAVNDLFLEAPGHYNDEAFCRRVLRQAALRARRRGSAVVIGHHYFRATLECLKIEVPKLQGEGITFVPVSALAW
ncbi:MAG: divergent polysaccharide deacetylase family protein [Elusimicrobia bacterium]|nr:divergent polysaccharide deacetylase family protein [Elusimicrobiota bacterium]